MVQYTLKIDGMMCGMCETHINDCIRTHFKAKKVSSSHRKGETVFVTESEINPEVLQHVIAETGYILQEIRQENAPQPTGFFGRFRKP